MLDHSLGAVPVTVANLLTGFVVPEAARFRFVAVDQRFGVLDGSRFTRPDDARRAAMRMARLVIQDRAGDQPGSQMRSAGCRLSGLTV